MPASAAAIRAVSGMAGETDTRVEARTTNAPVPGCAETGFGTTANGIRHAVPLDNDCAQRDPQAPERGCPAAVRAPLPLRVSVPPPHVALRQTRDRQPEDPLEDA